MKLKEGDLIQFEHNRGEGKIDKGVGYVFNTDKPGSEEGLIYVACSYEDGKINNVPFEKLTIKKKIKL